VQGVSGSNVNREKVIWAVGNKYGIKGKYSQYSIQGAEKTDPKDYYQGMPFKDTLGGVDTGDGDTANGISDSESGALAEVTPNGGTVADSSLLVSSPGHRDDTEIPAIADDPATADIDESTPGSSYTDS
jgi:hypothetical protein